MRRREFIALCGTAAEENPFIHPQAAAHRTMKGQASARSPTLRLHIIRVWFQTVAATYGPIDAAQHRFHVPHVVGFLPAPSPRWGCPAGSAVRARPIGRDTGLALQVRSPFFFERGRSRRARSSSEKSIESAFWRTIQPSRHSRPAKLS